MEKICVMGLDDAGLPAASLLATEGDLVIPQSTSPVESTEQVLDILFQVRYELELSTLDHLTEQSDIIVVIVSNRQFKRVQNTRIAEKVVFDSRGIWR